MTETIEQEAGRRVREQVGKPGSHSPGSLHALALEQLITEHRATKAELEAFRREVSDALEKRGFYIDDRDLGRFIIAKPDPLVVEAREICARVCEGWTDIPKNRAAAYRDGVHDDEADFAYVLNALRKANERPSHD